MLNMRGRTDVLFKRLSGLSLLRLVGKVILGVLTVQVLTAVVLLIIAALGKRRKHEISFPHEPFEEVRVGENVLQLYPYGRDLYDAMLEAIDAAQESIYLETFIWKDDAIGQEFQTHLTRKAAEGVAVYVIFDRFGNLVVDHRKLLIVDGKTSFIGGYNIGSVYATQWRDTHLGLRGPVAAELARSFVAFWNRFCPANERITHRHHSSVDSRITVSQNEAMRLSFPIRDLYIAAIDEARCAGACTLGLQPYCGQLDYA